MKTKLDLKDWVNEAVTSLNGRAHLIQVSKYIWDKYESELKDSGNLLYTWQYDMRWAAQKLRNEGTFKDIPKKDKNKGIWELANNNS